MCLGLSVFGIWHLGPMHALQRARVQHVQPPVLASHLALEGSRFSVKGVGLRVWGEGHGCRVKGMG